MKDCKTCIRLKDVFYTITQEIPTVQPHIPHLFIDTIFVILTPWIIVSAVAAHGSDVLPTALTERTDQIMFLSQQQQRLRITKGFHQFQLSS